MRAPFIVMCVFALVPVLLVSAQEETPIAIATASYPTPTTTPTLTPTPVQPTAQPLPTSTAVPNWTPVYGVHEGGTGESLDSDDSQPYQAEVKVYNFTVPNFPNMSSPTPNHGTGTGGGDSNLSEAEAAQATQTGNLNGFIGDASNALATAEFFATPQETSFETVDGGTLDMNAQLNTWDDWLLIFFGYIKGLNPQFWGRAAILLTVPLVAFVWVWGLQLMKFVWLVVLFILGILKEITSWAFNAIKALLPI